MVIVFFTQRYPECPECPAVRNARNVRNDAQNDARNARNVRNVRNVRNRFGGTAVRHATDGRKRPNDPRQVRRWQA